MKLSELLDVRRGVTAVIGGGGKTSLLSALGRELSDGGKQVLLCTTTKIYPFPDLPLAVSEEELDRLGRRHRLLCAGTPLPGTGKLTAPVLPMAALTARFDYVLAEADGSAGRPLKAHAPHEPVIPPEVNQVICVVGLTGLGQPISAAAHRPDLYARLAGVSVDKAVTPEIAARVLNDESTGWRYFLNQADTPALMEQARALAALLNGPAAAGSLRKGVYEIC